MVEELDSTDGLYEWLHAHDQCICTGREVHERLQLDGVVPDQQRRTADPLNDRLQDIDAYETLERLTVARRCVGRPLTDLGGCSPRHLRLAIASRTTSASSGDERSRLLTRSSLSFVIVNHPSRAANSRSKTTLRGNPYIRFIQVPYRRLVPDLPRCGRKHAAAEALEDIEEYELPLDHIRARATGQRQ